MIEYLLTAFFVAQPVPAAKGPPSAPPPVAEAPRGSPVEISSKRVTGSRSQAVFSGDVVARQGDLELRCDEMTAFYTGTRELSRVVCAGTMRAVQGERRAQGERAELEVATRALTVTGNPEASDGSIRLKGSVVRFRAGLPGPEYDVEGAAVTFESAPLKTPRRGSGREAPGARLPAEITARRVVGSRSQAVFTGDVLVRHRTLELRCDKLIASYTATRELTRADCVGNVRAVDGERQARGERAEFHVPTGVLVVTGNPEARDATTRLRGSEVRMTVGNANFEVKDAVITLETAPSASSGKGAGKASPGGSPGNSNAGSTKGP